MTYQAHIAGFSRTFQSLNDLRNWVHSLQDRYGVTGDLKIWQSQDGIEYNGAPSRVITI